MNGRLFHLDVESLLYRLKAGEHFAYAAWGDGEWQAVFESRLYDFEPFKRNLTLENEKFHSGLREAMLLCLTNYRGEFIGVPEILFDKIGDRIFDYLKELDRDWIPFYSPCPFHRMYATRGLGPLFEALKGRNVALVGPENLKPICDRANVKALIICPPEDAFVCKDRIRTRIEDTVMPMDNPVLLLCCGMLAPILVNHFAADFTVVDIGVIFARHLGIRRAANQARGASC